MTAAPLPPLSWTVPADEEQMLAFLLWGFSLCSSLSLSLSLRHRNLMLHFPSCSSSDTFSMPKALLFYNAGLGSQLSPLMIDAWSQEGTDSVKARETVWLFVHSLSSFCIHPVPESSGVPSSRPESPRKLQLSLCPGRHQTFKISDAFFRPSELLSRF